MDFGNFRANSLLKRALIVAIVASNMTFASSPAKANGSGAPTNVIAEAHPGKSATISWNAPANETELGIIEYYIELPGYLVDPNNVALCTVQATVNSAEHACTVQDLPTNNEPFHNYFFYVVAVDANGRINASYQQSNSVTIYDAPQGPSIPGSITGTAGNNSVRISWVAPIFDGASPITSYTAATSDGLSSCTTNTSLNCTINGLTNGQSYGFTVVATNVIGSSETGFLSRLVTPFAGNFDVLVPNSFDNYVNGHRQTRNMPSNKSIYNVRCDITGDTPIFTLGVINTQNSNYSNEKTIAFSDNSNEDDSLDQLSCETHAASGPNGVFVTIANVNGTSSQLYSLNPSTAEATRIAQIYFPDLPPESQGIVQSLTQDQSGILRVLYSIPATQFSFLALATGVINPTTGFVETPVVVGQERIYEFMEEDAFLLTPLGDLDSSLLNLTYSPGAVRAVLFQDNSGLTDSSLLVGELDVAGRLIESPFGSYLVPLNQFLSEDLNPFEFLVNSSSPIIPNEYLILLRNVLNGFSLDGYPSFLTYQNQAYILSSGDASDRAASLFRLNLTNGKIEALGDFPASSIPLGDGNLFATTTIDSSGVLWNLTGGVLQSESLSGFGSLGDYQVSLTEQSEIVDEPSNYWNSIFVSSFSPVSTPPNQPTNSAPSAPTSVVAKTTSKRSATVSFAPSASNGGSAITSYTATSSPGGITKTLTQSSGGTFTFDNLQPGMTYTFTVTATNAIGTSVATTSSSIKTMPLEVASISALSFIDDGTGTGGKIVWSGKSIDSVLYTGPASSYPGPYNYGAFSSGWNGRIRNLEPDKTYTISIFAVSPDGVGETKTLTFKTSATPPTLTDAANLTSMQSATTQLSQLIKWVGENTFVPGEATNMSKLLSRFDALETSAHRSYIKVPTSRVSNVDVKSLTPKACSVVGASAKVDAGLVTALSGDKCSISYTVTGASKAPATLVKDFFFKKYVK